MESEIIISIVLSYVIMGLSYAESAKEEPPKWNFNSSISQFAFFILFWPYVTYLEYYFKSKGDIRGIAYSIVYTLTTVLLSVLFFFLSYKIADLITTITFLQIIISIFVFYLLLFVFSPFASIIGLILFFPIGVILDIFFPFKEEDK